MTDELEQAPGGEHDPATRPGSLDDLRPKMRLSGKVARLELYGAFIDLGVGTNAILHISQMGQPQVNRIADVLSVGDEVTVWVDQVDPARGQVTVSMVEPLALDWGDLKEGQTYAGTVTRLEKFGAFVNIGAEKEGLIHVSEMSHEFVKHPSEKVKVGDEVQVRLLGFSKRKRRIDLSMKSQEEQPARPAAPQAPNQESAYDEDEDEEAPTAMEIALREALGGDYSPRDKRKQLARKGRQRQQRLREQQDEIISRTLRMRE